VCVGGGGGGVGVGVGVGVGAQIRDPFQETVTTSLVLSAKFFLLCINVF
jgi:hypothetical protein